MRRKRTWEEKFGIVLGCWFALLIILVSLHIWQESMGEDSAWVWSCHTMGHRDCGPGVPWHGISWNGGGED